LLLATASVALVEGQESYPTVRGIVLDRTLSGKGVPSVMVRADPPGNPRISNSDGTFTLEFPQSRPGAPIKITLEKRDDRDGEDYIVVNDVQLETFLPKDAKQTLTFILCKKIEREDYARHFYKIQSLKAIKGSFDRQFAIVTAAKERLEQEFKAAVEAASSQREDLMRQINEKEQTISQLQQKLAQAENEVQSVSEALAAGTASENSERFRKAMRLFLDGKADEALTLLDEDAISQEIHAAQKEIINQQKLVQQSINELVLKAGIYTSELRLDEAKGTYLRAISEAGSSFEARYGYAELSRVTHDYPTAMDNFRKSAKLAAERGENVKEAEALTGLGNSYAEKEDYELAIEPLKKVLSTYDTLAQEDAASFNSRLVGALINLGLAERHLQPPGRAKEHFERAKELLEKIPNPESPTNLNLSATLGVNLGNFYLAQSRLIEARDEFKSSAEVYADLAQSDARSYEPLQALALNNLGAAELEIGKAASNIQLRRNSWSDAEAHLGAAEKIRKQLAAEAPEIYRPLYGQTLQNLGDLYMTEFKFALARQTFQETETIRKELALKDSSAYQNEYANTLTSFGIMCGMQYSLAHDAQFLSEAALNVEEAVKLRETLAKKNPSQYIIPLGDSLETLGKIYVGQGRPTDASATFNRALDNYSKLNAPSAAYPSLRTLGELGHLELQQGHKLEAQKAFERAMSFFEIISPEEKAVHREVVLNIASTLAALKASSKAEQAAPK
jgi:hypothetical protein